MAAWESKSHPPPACKAQQARKAELAAVEAAAVDARESRAARQLAEQLAAQEDFVRRQVLHHGACLMTVVDEHGHGAVYVLALATLDAEVFTHCCGCCHMIWASTRAKSSCMTRHELPHGTNAFVLEALRLIAGAEGVERRWRPVRTVAEERDTEFGAVTDAVTETAVMEWSLLSYRGLRALPYLVWQHN